MAEPRRTTGEMLNKRWNIGARQTRYNDKGMFYRLLDDFPAALCDPNGYVRFQTRREYELSALAIGRRINAYADISKLDGYRPVAKSLRLKV